MSDFAIVKKYVDEMDYHSLLSHGAPGDEFDSESKEIIARISKNQTDADIARIIADIFNKSFGYNDPVNLFMDCAGKIAYSLGIASGSK